MTDDGVDLLGHWIVHGNKLTRFTLWARADQQDEEPTLLIQWTNDEDDQIHQVWVSSVRQWIRDGIVKPYDPRTAGE